MKLSLQFITENKIYRQRSTAHDVAKFVPVATNGAVAMLPSPACSLADAESGRRDLDLVRAVDSMRAPAAEAAGAPRCSCLLMACWAIAMVATACGLLADQGLPWPAIRCDSPFATVPVASPPLQKFSTPRVVFRQLGYPWMQ